MIFVCTRTMRSARSREHNAGIKFRKQQQQEQQQHRSMEGCKLQLFILSSFMNTEKNSIIVLPISISGININNNTVTENGPTKFPLFHALFVALSVYGLASPPPQQ